MRKPDKYIYLIFLRIPPFGVAHNFQINNEPSRDIKNMTGNNSITDKDAPLLDGSSSEKSKMSIPVEVRYTDMDTNGHMFFGNYFTLFDTAFLKYLNIIGCSYNWFLSNNLNFYYVEAKSQFKSSIKFEDEISVEVDVTSMGKTSFTTSFKAINKTNNCLAAFGHIVSVVVNLKTEKPAPLPEELIEAFKCTGP